MILAPCRPRAIATKDEDGETAAIQPAVRHYRPVYVFDVAQTEGQELPQPARVQGDPGRCIERLERYLREEMGVTVEYVDHLGGAHGVSMGGRIQVLRHLDDAHRFSVLLHEAAHEAAHWTAPAELRKNKTLVETQAEAIAYTVCHALGLDTGTAAADYISLYRGNHETLRQSLETIHRVAGRLLEAVADAPDLAAALAA